MVLEGGATKIEEDCYTASKSNPHRDIVFVLRFFGKYYFNF